MAEGEKKKVTPSAEKIETTKKETNQKPKVIGHDPKTGAPIFDIKDGEKPIGFDPKTGEPIFKEKDDNPTEEKASKEQIREKQAEELYEKMKKKAQEEAGIQEKPEKVAEEAAMVLDESSSEEEKLPDNVTVKDGVKIVKTDVDSKDGQVTCPHCGATDISTNFNNGKLRCNYCRREFDPIKVSGFVEDISKLEGKVVASGATDIIADTKDVITLKCQSCGAEVVVDTASSTQARCHWCRHTLSVNNQIPNGAIPDVVLPFTVKKDDARYEIERFVGKRKFFAHPQFAKEFTTENIMGVYFPYMLVDVNAHAAFSGEGEHQTRAYWVGSDEHKQRRYDADLYHVERHFDITINGLSVESNSDRLNSASAEKTNNIINAVMPFDIENCVKYDSNYIKGFTSEKRDVNIEQLRPVVQTQSQDIARIAANETLKHYDRGVCWGQEVFKMKGEQWKAAYLPVWLYSYQEKKGNKSLLHYVAVNARTKETMGSVPIHMPKLIIVSIIVEILAILGLIVLSDVDFDLKYALVFTGLIYYLIIYSKYRNKGARHRYELETTRKMDNMKQVDDYIKKETGLSNSRIRGCNNTRVSGVDAGSQLFDSLAQGNFKGVLSGQINPTIPNDDNQDNTIIK